MKHFSDGYVQYWYKQNYKNDADYKYINPALTFKDVLVTLIHKPDHFNNEIFVLGYYDSIIRERIFQGLADALDMDYDDVYELWTRAEYERNREFKKQVVYRLMNHEVNHREAPVFMELTLADYNSKYRKSYYNAETAIINEQLLFNEQGKTDYVSDWFVGMQQQG